MAVELRLIIAKAANGSALSREEASAAFEQIESGEANPFRMGAMAIAPTRSWPKR